MFHFTRYNFPKELFQTAVEESSNCLPPYLTQDIIKKFLLILAAVSPYFIVALTCTFLLAIDFEYFFQILIGHLSVFIFF